MSEETTVIDCTAKVTMSIERKFNHWNELPFTVKATDCDNEKVHGWLTPETAKEVISVLAAALEANKVDG